MMNAGFENAANIVLELHDDVFVFHAAAASTACMSLPLAGMHLLATEASVAQRRTAIFVPFAPVPF